MKKLLLLSLLIGPVAFSSTPETMVIDTVLDELIEAEPVLRSLSSPFLNEALDDLNLIQLKEDKQEVLKDLTLPRDFKLGLSLTRPVISYFTEQFKGNGRYSNIVSKTFPEVKKNFFDYGVEMEISTLYAYGEPRTCYRRDALRHSMWSSALTKKFGKYGALIITAAHELDLNGKGDLRDNESLMDLSNNIMAIYLAHINPDFNLKELKVIHKMRIQNGETFMLEPTEFTKEKRHRNLVPTRFFQFIKNEFTEKFGC